MYIHAVGTTSDYLVIGFLHDPPRIVRIFLAGLMTGAGGGIFFGWSTYGGPLAVLLIGPGLFIAGGFWLLVEIREMRAELRQW